jgi:hypothetical protein
MVRTDLSRAHTCLTVCLPSIPGCPAHSCRGPRFLSGERVLQIVATGNHSFCAAAGFLRFAVAFSAQLFKFA